MKLRGLQLQLRRSLEVVYEGRAWTAKVQCRGWVKPRRRLAFLVTVAAEVLGYIDGIVASFRYEIFEIFINLCKQ